MEEIETKGRCRVMVVFGTRPEAIKMCVLVNELRKNPEDFETLVCVTGQHRQLLDSVLEIFGVDPDFDLNIMKFGQDLTDITSRVLEGMRDVLNKCNPDIVLVHGDTTTSMAAALAAFYCRIPVGHIEAGLRTGNIYDPWPEEMNRLITGRIACYNFAPTNLSCENLKRENAAGDIIVTGNTVIDALHAVVDRLENNDRLKFVTNANLMTSGYDSRRLDFGRRLVLVTGHRRENFGDGFHRICTAVKILSEKYPDVDFVYPMHPNPNVRRAVEDVFGKKERRRRNLFLIEPLQYVEFVWMMRHSYLVLTDSGGIQEEAPGLGKPVLVMRETTERPEAITAGTVLLVGTDTDKIVSSVSKLMDNQDDYARMSHAVNPYGDGTACRKIVSYLKNVKKKQVCR